MAIRVANVDPHNTFDFGLPKFYLDLLKFWQYFNIGMSLELRLQHWSADITFTVHHSNLHTTFQPIRV